MKVKFQQIQDSVAALKALSVCPLQIKLSYKIGRVLIDVSRELELFHKFHVELIRKHGGVENDEGGLNVPDDRLEDFKPEFAELLEQEVELWGSPIRLDEFLSSESITCESCNRLVRKGEPEISAASMSALTWLIDGETPNPSL